MVPYMLELCEFTCIFLKAEVREMFEPFETKHSAEKETKGDVIIKECNYQRVRN